LAATWAAASRRETAAEYGRWLSWLEECGFLDPTVPPAGRITRKRVRAYAMDLGAVLSPHTVVTRLLQLSQALRALEPSGDWRWIARAASRLRDTAKPVRNKRARLQTPARLAALGERLMTAAVSPGNAVGRAAARSFRNGLMIALLAHRPIRACNLTAITLGKHLTKRGDSWWLVFAATETKTKQPLEMPLPGALTRYLERYLELYRPVLLTRGGRHPPAQTKALWISRNGTQMAFTSISYWVKRHTAEAFGTPINLHLFRDCAATTIATVAPENVRIVTAILGHANLATSERHYNQARSIEAGRRYHDTVAALRSRANSRPERRDGDGRRNLRRESP
jgi:integrase